MNQLEKYPHAFLSYKISQNSSINSWDSKINFMLNGKNKDAIITSASYYNYNNANIIFFVTKIIGYCSAKGLAVLHS